MRTRQHLFLFILEINDIGILGLKELREKLKDACKWVQSKLPESVLFFHKYYREPSGDIQKITNQWKKSRLRINNEVASNVLRNEGCYVRYTDIKATISLLDDGVHLNELGSTYY